MAFLVDLPMKMRIFHNYVRLQLGSKCPIRGFSTALFTIWSLTSSASRWAIPMWWASRIRLAWGFEMSFRNHQDHSISKILIRMTSACSSPQFYNVLHLHHKNSMPHHSGSSHPGRNHRCPGNSARSPKIGRGPGISFLIPVFQNYPYLSIFYPYLCIFG